VPRQRQRLALVLLESGLLGLAGSVAGIALGTLLAQAALHLLGGDLGGGYFAGVQPALRWSTATALLYGSLGLVAALAGGWWPARNAQALPPAQTLKGPGPGGQRAQPGHRWPGAAGCRALLALAPPIAGVPVAAYVSVGLLLVGGMALLPWAVALLLRLLHPLAASRALPLLALERARRMRGSAAIAIGGVVASLSLAVALTVMVASFRGSVMQWLDAVLPAPLYLRSSLQAAGGDAALLPATLAQDVARLSGVQRVEPQRASPVQLDPARPALTLLARPLGSDPAQRLPLVDAALPVPPGRVGIYISEAVVDLYGLQPGMDWPALSRSFRAPGQEGKAQAAPFFIAGVWRDYARQSGAVALDQADYERLTGDARPTDLALWPQPGTDSAALRQAIEALAPGVEDGTGPGWNSSRPMPSAPARCTSSTAASPSPTGCRPWPLASASSAWRPALAPRCWRGARNSACSPTWASRAARFWPWWPAKARPGRGGRGRRPAAGPGRIGGAGACGQPAELPLDHGFAGAAGAAAGAVRCRGAGGHGDGLGGRASGCGAGCGVGGEGGLVGSDCRGLSD
jgi:putative ABC transport system permease protein